MNSTNGVVISTGFRFTNGYRFMEDNDKLKEFCEFKTFSHNGEETDYSLKVNHLGISMFNSSDRQIFFGFLSGVTFHDSNQLVLMELRSSCMTSSHLVLITQASFDFFCTQYAQHLKTMPMVNSLTPFDENKATENELFLSLGYKRRELDKFKPIHLYTNHYLCKLGKDENGIFRFLLISRFRGLFRGVVLYSRTSRLKLQEVEFIHFVADKVDGKLISPLNLKQASPKDYSSYFDSFL